LIFDFISKPYLLCLEFLLMLARVTSRPSSFTLLAASDASNPWTLPSHCCHH